MHGSTLWSFYIHEAQRQMNAAAADIRSADDWQQQRPELHRQFMASMGLDPLPPRCELAVQDHGHFAGQGYRAVRLSWQILPGCVATGHYYLPDPLPAGPLPGVLYTCGHKPTGILGYQHHAIAWARRGYACLIFDTIEQHDNRGDHHGLYYGTRSDWISLGYSGAGGELWNSIRAMDVLASRPEVDAQRLGVTGISGGGAHSFFLAVADERIKTVATVAGVSSFAYALEQRFLQGHCDCMYPHNPFGRDIAEFAALIAPRPALFAFARHDPLYMPEEFRSLVARTQRIYELLGHKAQCSLFEYDGPHAYQPETIECIQRWFDQHLAREARPTDTRTDHEHDDATMTIFNGAPPASDRLDLLPELLPARGGVELPRTAEQWPTIRQAALDRLKREVLMLAHDEVAGSAGQPGRFETVGKWQFEDGIKHKYRAESGGMEVMTMLVAPRDYANVVVSVAGPDDEIYQTHSRAAGAFAGLSAAILSVEPRGTGFTATHPDHARHLLRAGALVGLTPTMLMIQDLWRLMPQLHELPEVVGRGVYLHGRGEAAVACLYHALFDPRVAGVVLEAPPSSHREGGFILNVLRCLDMPEAVGLMAPRRAGLVLHGTSGRPWKWAQRVYSRLGQSDALTIGSALSPVAGQVIAGAFG